MLFERAKQDPNIASHMAKADKFGDDEAGNLVRLDGGSPASGGGSLRAAPANVMIGATGKTVGVGKAAVGGQAALPTVAGSANRVRRKAAGKAEDAPAEGGAAT
jgi:hypothetical protein